jgi:glycosyltransferase involved in cell wall biosynthesis
MNQNKTKRRLVVVTSRFPIPLKGGFEIKNYHLLKYLSRYFDIDVHFVQFGVPDEKGLAEIGQFCRTVHVHRPRLPEVALRMVLALFRREPLQCALYFSSEASKRIRHDLADADAALCSVIRTSQYILGFDGPKFFDLADSLGQIYKHNAARSRGLLKLAYLLEGPRLLRLEKRLVDKARGVFFFNKEEAALYKAHHSVSVVPHGVNSRLFDIEQGDDRFADGLTVIGKMNVVHNVDMVKWFVKHVMPLLPQQIRLFIIGSDPSPDIAALAAADPRVQVMGFMDDPYPAIKSSVACICPLQIGGGVQNKMIESMAVGAVTISSSRATTALPNLDQSGILVCDKPDEWAAQILDIRAHPEKYEGNRRMGREYARQQFSWDAYGSAIRSAIDSNVLDESTVLDAHESADTELLIPQMR